MLLALRPALLRRFILTKYFSPNLPPDDCQANGQEYSERNAHKAIEGKQGCSQKPTNQNASYGAKQASQRTTIRRPGSIPLGYSVLLPILVAQRDILLF